MDNNQGFNPKEVIDLSKMKPPKLNPKLSDW